MKKLHNRIIPFFYTHYSTSRAPVIEDWVAGQGGWGGGCETRNLLVGVELYRTGLSLDMGCINGKYLT